MSNLHGQRGRNRLRHLQVHHRPGGNGNGAFEEDRSRQLLEKEWVAAALVIQAGCHRTVYGFAKEFLSLAASESGEFDAVKQSRPMGTLEGSIQSPGCLTRTDRDSDKHGGVRRVAEQGAEQLHRGGVSPVDVIEHQHQRLGRRQSFEQVAHSAVSAVALVQRPSRAGFRGSGH